MSSLITLPPGALRVPPIEQGCYVRTIMEHKANGMNSRFKVTSAANENRSGHTMLESVFTLLPMFALLFGIIDLCVMTFRWSTLQNAVREGVRYAITFQTSGALGQTASIQGVVEQNSLGFVKASDSPQHIFVSYMNPDLTQRLQYPRQRGGSYRQKHFFQFYGAAEWKLCRSSLRYFAPYLQGSGG